MTSLRSIRVAPATSAAHSTAAAARIQLRRLPPAVMRPSSTG
jgi:hypothetical protein